MADVPQLTPVTVARLATESVPIKMSDADRQTVTNLVGNLSKEIEVMRKLAVGEADPALIYHASRS